MLDACRLVPIKASLIPFTSLIGDAVLLRPAQSGLTETE
jgi:hypothetical protein